MCMPVTPSPTATTLVRGMSAADAVGVVHVDDGGVVKETMATTVPPRPMHWPIWMAA